MLEFDYATGTYITTPESEAVLAKAKAVAAEIREELAAQKAAEQEAQDACRARLAKLKIDLKPVARRIYVEAATKEVVETTKDETMKKIDQSKVKPFDHAVVSKTETTATTKRSFFMNCNDHALASAEAELQAARVVANQKSKALSCVYDAYKKAEASNAAYVTSYKNTSFAAVAAERAEASNAAYNEALNAARQAYYAASDKVGEMQAKWNEIDLQIWRSKKQNKENEDE